MIQSAVFLQRKNECGKNHSEASFYNVTCRIPYIKYSTAVELK